MTWRGRLIGLLGFLVGAGFLALAIARLDITRVVRSVQSAHLWPWLPLAVLCYVAGHFARGRRLRRLVSREATLTTITATNVVVVGYAVNNLLPARLGELARAWMLTERSGLSFVQSLTVTLLERVLDGLVLLALLGVTLVVLPPAHSASLLPVAALVFGVAALLILVAVFAPGMLVATASRATQRIAPRAHDAAIHHASAIVNAVAYLRSPLGALRVTALGVFAWLCEAGMFFCLLPAFEIPARPATALLAMTSTNLAILVPSTPGYIGPFHYFCMRAVVSTGVAPDVAFGYALLVHLAFYVPITVWGVGVLFAQGLSVGRTLTLGRMARPLDTLPAGLAGLGTMLSSARRIEKGQAPSRFMLALAEATVPHEVNELPESDRALVIREVAGFVDGQMEALPFRLRLLFGIGMSGFRATTRVTQLHGFCSLESRRRRLWLERWAYGPWALGRQLFRGVRSTALLAYYEQPVVRRTFNAPTREAP